MPFQLNHKSSKSKLKSSPIHETTPTLPTTSLPLSTDSSNSQKGFNMFWRKKSSSSGSGSGSGSDKPGSNYQNQPIEPPRPILRMNTEGQGVSSIRFAGSSSSSSPRSNHFPPHPTMRTVSSPASYGHNNNGNNANQVEEMSINRVRTQTPAPRVIVSSYDSYNSPSHPQPHQRMASYDSSPLSIQPRMISSPRRSSRPTSPSTSSFGARTRSTTEPIPTIRSYSSSSSSSSTSSHNTNGSDGNRSPLSMAGPLETPPMPSSHVTTPPTAYVSSFQSRAPPPPSPYRPTNERRRSSLTRNLPENLPKMNDFAPAPIQETFLSTGDSKSSVHTLNNGPDVPMLNIIPATPQNQSEEFTSIWEQQYPSSSSNSSSSPKTATKLEEAVTIATPQEEEEEMVNISLDLNLKTTSDLDLTLSSEPKNIPSIDLELDFSPFQPLAELPDTDTPLEEISDFITSEDLQRIELSEEVQYDYSEEMPEGGEGMIYDEEDEEYDETENVPSEPLPPSPPFMSYPSLPSLSSHSHDHESIRSSASDCSMTTSSSMSSLVSFPDVEEALGSMLASLSDSSMASTAIQTPTKDQSLNSVYHNNSNPGLGLGLNLDHHHHQSSTNTAPLSPRKRAPPPPPLDLTKTQSKNRNSANSGSIHSAPIINHRIAFYTTAKAHPNSPSSGIFTSSSSLASSASSSSTISLTEQQQQTNRKSNHCYRDSISLTSEASDEDLHTASIISLTPIIHGNKVRGGTYSKDVLSKEEIIDETQLPYAGTEEQQQEEEEIPSNLLGLGLGLGLTSDIGMGFNSSSFGRTAFIERQAEGHEHEHVEVGLAL
ncbi:uncharacterized protein L201_005538 [Kwoniella dendrophila CBS 6074]|uniref:AGC protein kinase n=1 Tax=Kwoniella dendrophila CBS 6074 TaxID=1295534 RepID=A0AAX4JZ22_9TREE